jgi:anti-sigma regulatory factor (Ser/Thr protein kinase)
MRHDLTPSSNAAVAARAALDEWLSDLIGEETAERARLCATELIANAIQHGVVGDADPITVSGVATDDVIVITVEQPTSAAAARVLRRPAPDDHFGLMVVEELSDAWGVDAGPPGRVWFELQRKSR